MPRLQIHRARRRQLRPRLPKPPRLRVLPYKQGSASAKALANALGCKMLKLTNSVFRARPQDIIINWGNSGHNYSGLNRSFNLHNIHLASNKLAFFKLMGEQSPESIPPFWTNREEIPEDAYPVVCRTMLSSHSGRGIVIADTIEQLVDAPLYVKYIKKKEEYRVHVGVFNGEAKVISIRRKVRRLACETPEWRIRNKANGFVFQINNLAPNPDVLEVAKKALQVTGLDFGAVDVVFNERQQKAYALEINTAPGLEGQTILDYANFIKEALNNAND